MFMVNDIFQVVISLYCRPFVPGPSLDSCKDGHLSEKQNATSSLSNAGNTVLSRDN